VVNVVHPRAIQFDAMMGGFNTALVEHEVVSKLLPTMAFKAWVDMLEKISADASPEDMRTIVSVNYVLSVFF
jgi:hypothetical protein